MEPNNNRPTGRKRNVTGKADPIKKKEQGLGTGPVGNGKPGSLPHQTNANTVHKTEVIHETRPRSSSRGVKRGGKGL